MVNRYHSLAKGPKDDDKLTSKRMAISMEDLIVNLCHPLAKGPKDDGKQHSLPPLS